MLFVNQKGSLILTHESIIRQTLQYIEVLTLLRLSSLSAPELMVLAWDMAHDTVSHWAAA